jgi:hypothetical protein
MEEVVGSIPTRSTNKSFKIKYLMELVRGRTLNLNPHSTRDSYRSGLDFSDSL